MGMVRRMNFAGEPPSTDYGDDPSVDAKRLADCTCDTVEGEPLTIAADCPIHFMRRGLPPIEPGANTWHWCDGCGRQAPWGASWVWFGSSVRARGKACGAQCAEKVRQAFREGVLA
jgi:hypothetical protein